MPKSSSRRRANKKKTCDFYRNLPALAMSIQMPLDLSPNDPFFFFSLPFQLDAESVRHLVVIPVYEEPLEVVSVTVSTLAAQNSTMRCCQNSRR